MYRPTVRMDDCFRNWIEGVAKASGLDRNQVIRLALFSAPFSAVFVAQINSRKKTDVNLPPPPWQRETDGGPWRESSWNRKGREGDVNENINQKRKEISNESVGIVEPRGSERFADVSRNETNTERRERQIHQSKRFKPAIESESRKKTKNRPSINFNGNRVTTTKR